MKSKRFRLVLSAGVSLAVIPTLVAASCGENNSSSTNSAELSKAKTEARVFIDGYNNLSMAAKNGLKNQLNALTSTSRVQTFVEDSTKLNEQVALLNQSLNSAKQLKNEAETVFDTIKNKYNSAVTNAENALADSKLKVVGDTLSSTLANVILLKNALLTSTQEVTDAKTNIEHHASLISTIKTELNKASVPVVDLLKAKLMATVDTSGDVNNEQSVNNVVKVNTLLSSLKSLKTEVLKALKVRTDYPRNYYNATNKQDFDNLVNKLLVIYPAYDYANANVVSSINSSTNPRVWASARTSDSLKLVNFIKETDDKIVSEEATIDTTLELLAKLEKELKNQTASLNGETNESKLAYFKNPQNVVFRWNEFLPKIIIADFAISTEFTADDVENIRNFSNGVISNELAMANTKVAENIKKLKEKLTTWFATTSNWSSLVDTLIKQYGSEIINNVELVSPEFSFKHVYYDNNNNRNRQRNLYSTPVVTFTVKAKDGYTLAEGQTPKVSFDLSVLRNTESNEQLRYPSLYFTTIPGRPVNEKNVKLTNEYLNDVIYYNGPEIPFDLSAIKSRIGRVVLTNKATVNGTSTVEEEEVRKWLSSQDPSNQLRLILRNYINKYDGRFNVNNASNSGRTGVFLSYPIFSSPERFANGTTIPAIRSDGYNLKLQSLEDVREDFWLQEIKGDREAVYIPLQALNSGWLRTFLVRIPLHKFIKPINPIVNDSTDVPADNRSNQPSVGQ
ncbi:hypothetical protein ACJA23_03340 [Mycoplasma corogypsi]|uniref:hypothetical protein n=1 Tax=Mycoplasma corogypsi TaxID=2106 RepID=UPI003873C463